LFVHRDAESASPTARKAEIQSAVDLASQSGMMPPAICVIPVRMQEAWLLFDEVAIRTAAGHPNGRQPLTLPDIRRLEHLPDPKNVLHELLREASGLQGKRRKRFPVKARIYRIAEFITDFSPLRPLPAFATLEADLSQIVRDRRWNTN
jgi:hypothetical protein